MILNSGLISALAQRYQRFLSKIANCIPEKTVTISIKTNHQLITFEIKEEEIDE
ncbi:hypothetical protein CSC18_4646 [Klebsiella aerogenes]|nr:hypothetical protein CSC18_4646 [Klebsiella aerogenes]